MRKILTIADRRGLYYVPFHEFTKSVMLDDRLFYREGDTEDEVLNVFAVAGVPPNSHFTALRVLSYLMENSEVRSPYGPGFVEWDRLVDIFERIFGDSRDLRFHLERLLYRSLIESDTGVTSGEHVLDQCRAVRATPSGEYYLTYLSRAFAYVDLVWIDTPLADSALLTELRNLVGLRDRTSRFSRVDAFLAYLGVEEQREHRDFPLLRGADWAGPFVSKIQSQIEREKRFIRGRLARYDHWGAGESHPSG